MTIVTKIGAVCLGVLISAGAAFACPDYSKSGARYDYSGSELYQERRFEVRAGGNYNVQGCPIRLQSDKGRGFFTSQPDFTFKTYGMKGYRLVVSVVSECDSALLINTGAANWYYDDDDNGNLDARISLTRPSDGWLDVWVGTHDGTVCDAILSLETFN